MPTTVSIGSNQNIDTAVPNTLVSGSGPSYTITWNKTLSSDVAVGDLATATDVPDGAFVYLKTAISGSNYTLKYCTGSGGAQSPTDLCSDEYCSGPPTFTFKRAFSTITAFEVMVDDSSPDYWGSSDDVIGECHKDSDTFDENNISFNNKHSLSSVTLTVYEDDRHDGTAAHGVVLQPESGGTHDHGVIRINIDNMTVEWLDINFGELSSTNDTNKAILFVGTNNNNIIRNNIIHDRNGNPGNNGIFFIHAIGAGASSDTIYILNNITNNAVETSNDSSSGINLSHWAGNSYIYNNTVYNIQGQGGTKRGIGFRFGNPTSANTRIKNNIASKCQGNTSRAYWKNSSGSTVDSANNLSDDTSDAAYNAEDMGQNLDDSSALIGKTLAQIDFVSTSPGSEDLHLDASSVCLEAGVDLGTTNEVNIDIDGFDRDANDVTWDIGADQRSTGSSDTGSAFLLFIN